MKVRVVVVLAILALVGSVAGASAQSTGEIYGKVTDTSGAVMPGVTVILTGDVLLQPQTAVTTETGAFQFPRLAIGVYTVKFELTGFKTVVKEGVRVSIGVNAQVIQSMEISTVQETVTVSGETPLVDLKDTSRTNHFNNEALQSIPSARDPWVIMEQSAGIMMDRQNIGGNMSGQQSNFIARGAASGQQKWNLDGVDITDLNSQSSPVYYDFDAFEEMQISTGGADVAMQTPGVGINLVTKSGTDKFRGSGRFYVTDDSVEKVNVDLELRKQGATSGSPIQNIKDYGFEVGGPIKKGRAWIWGSYGRQNIKVGVNGFYKPDATCQAMKKDPLSYEVKEIWGCLNTDLTELKTFNVKFAVQTFKNNQFSFYMNTAGKIRNARGADDLHPIESTNRQQGVSADAGLGSTWWKTGLPKTYKFSDRHIFSDKFMMEFQYAHVGNNFVLDFHDPALSTVQPSLEIATGMWGRSFQAQQFVRPTDTIDITSNYFQPSLMGADHAFKFGLKLRSDDGISTFQMGGNAIARFRGTTASEAQIYRDSITDYTLANRSFYAQDTMTRKKLTVTLGLRYDFQHDKANAGEVPASPFFGKTTYTGQVFDQLPAVKFAGYNPEVSFKNFSPRASFTYDLTGNGRNVVKANFSRYVDQLSSGSLSANYNPVAVGWVRYPWIDSNVDGFVQANEIDMRTLLSWSGVDPFNPTVLSSAGKVDPNITAQRTSEFIIGYDRQIGAQFAVGASYIYRKYNDFRTTYTDNWGPANYTPVQYTPTCTVAGAVCNTVTYFQPTSQSGAAYTQKNQTGYSRDYKGFELTWRKRQAHRWSMNGSFSYNSTPEHYKDGAYQDPTNIATLDGGQYSPVTSGSGLDNVYINARWIFRTSGTYTLPWWDINLAGFYNARDGYPFPQVILTPTRPFAGGQANVLLFPQGDVRLPWYQNVDFRVDKAFTVAKRIKVAPSMDLFNLFNGNTVQSRRRTQNASNANLISAITAPFVARFGVRVTW